MYLSQRLRVHYLIIHTLWRFLAEVETGGCNQALQAFKRDPYTLKNDLLTNFRAHLPAKICAPDPYHARPGQEIRAA